MYYIYKKALLCYNIFQSLLASRVMSYPWFIPQNTSFIVRYLCVIFHCAGNICVWVSVRCLCSVAEDSVHALGNRGGEGEVKEVAKLFWLII